ncbi:MAG: hypothetical protein GC200_08265 [Tepidisphaera sp.]|nr:hypothetical protein [Tepidisphaera sp.]
MSEHQEVTAKVGWKGRKTISLMRVALRQRSLQRSVGAYLLTLVVSIGASSAAYPSQAVQQMVAMCAGGALMAAAVWAIVATVRLQTALGRNVVLACIMSIGMLIPIVNILFLASHDGRATKLLKKHGVRVGLLGVPRDELHKLVQGACRKCGYDVRTITGPVCPECGTPLPAAPAAVAPAA